MAESEDARLIARCRAGDRAAQEALVRRHQDQVYRLACRLVGDPEEASDVAQEALIAMLRSLGAFRGEARFETWLFRVTTNICLMQRRRRQARTRLITDLAVTCCEHPPAGNADPESAAASRELQGAVRECLRRLPAEFRAVVVLRELEGLSYEEIAQVLKLPLGTVQSRLSRGRRLLREALLADERVALRYGRGEKA